MERESPDTLSRGLGVFSLALGAAQVASPRGLVNLVGMEDTKRNRDLMLALGLRELASGVGILSQRQPAGWLQARVGGDVMDLALLGSALATDGRNRDRKRLGIAIAAVAGVLALDVLAARRATDGRRAGERSGIHVARSVTVLRSPEEVYAFWRDFQNLPRFMRHLESVHVTGDGRSHWRAKAPAGMSVEWDAEMVAERPNELIVWRSLPGSTVPNSGQVRFVEAPGGRGTEVHLELRYAPPGGKLGAVVAKLFGEEPGQQAADDLRRFKQVMETGEVVRSDASIHRHMHPAQPPEEPVSPELAGRTS
ncbi:MAG TPA: SRPBCC family protein [Gemmatimonadales bacterium]|nr:SRPBCC family protein [Gemmatimonadales bacterium]